MKFAKKSLKEADTKLNQIEPSSESGCGAPPARALDNFRLVSLVSHTSMDFAI